MNRRATHEKKIPHEPRKLLRIRPTMRFVDDFVRFVDFLLQAFNIRTTYPIVRHLKEIPTTTMKKVNALSNKASLGTYLTLALGAGALGSHDTKAAIITSPVNETSINEGDPIFITFSNGVISSGQGTGDIGPGDELGTLTGFSGLSTGKGSSGRGRIIYDVVNDNPGTWSFVSLQPLTYGTTIDASTSWGGEQTSGIGGGYVRIDQGLSNAYYGLKFYTSPGVYNYGWMQVSTPGYDLTFGNAAVETIANTSIGAGVTNAVPEPSTFAMMALAGGAVALRLLRKKKAA
jgi:hypothetical protein